MSEFLAEVASAMVFLTIIVVLGDLINLWDVVSWV